MWEWLKASDGATRWRIAAALVGLTAAFFWMKSSLVPIPLSPGAAIGETSPADPFNVALQAAGWWNKWAAGLTALSVALTVIAEGLGIWRRARDR
jgi:hypothetical protein